MLSDKQKEFLKKLTEECPIPKLKRILEDAVPKWISGEVEPKRYSLGVYFRNEKFTNSIAFESDNFGCCLLGTSIINESDEIDTHPYTEIRAKYDLSYDDYNAIADGFDGKGYGSGYSVSMWKYCREISKVIFNDM